jgi:XTP/dITP diphosphohydrolase
MKKIVLASNNKHKIKEFNEILDNVEILTLNDIEFFSEIEETGKTFLENALIKASTISKYLKSKNLDYDVIADDSGLCSEALNGAPGIYSARYSGIHDDSKANRDKLINDLKCKDKTAYFNATIVLYHIDGTYEYKEGKTYGKIIEEELGNTSFGYDCIFLSDDLNKTFGEATSEEKNSVSHRARALEQIKELI